ncbi:uncharacterized protein LOC130993804 [Salvia miltiorrhiza]|uniref:uncharacterized protein LOC130993804 n=1 Tax=Salvia miltiorrhiza TaxID=226208 RepID=UPI0025AD1369|nr:uncharacterized protein LOC130993804 [Salvia miltiorrhiza]
MQKELLLRIVVVVQGEDGYFRMGHDAVDRDSFTLLQKCTVAIRQLAIATGVSADTFDEYLKVADTTRNLCLKKFCRAVIRTYSVEYLRHPTPSSETRHGFSEMLGSLDCMHWAWKNCPKGVA